MSNSERNTQPDQDGSTFTKDLEISALSNDQIIDAPTTVSIRDAAAIMDDEGIGLLVLKDGERLTGVVSERDIVRAVANGLDLGALATSVVSERADQAIHRAAPTSTVGDVAREMMENYIRHVLIVGEDGKPTGVVSIRDLLALVAT